jgi:ketopantoate reductase
MLWSKLCLLAPFALATTASGESLGIVRSDPRWWSRLRACVDEACAVGVAEGAGSRPRTSSLAAMTFTRATNGSA